MKRVFIEIILLPIIQKLILDYIEDIDFMVCIKNIYSKFINIMNFKISIGFIVFALCVCILLKKIYYYFRKNKAQTLKIDFKKLTEREKEILDKFYIKELNKYTNSCKIIPHKYYEKEVELLQERGILEKLNEYEIFENYTSDGTWHKLTEKAIEELNKEMKKLNKKIIINKRKING